MAKIPETKRSADELARMQMRNAMQACTHVEQYRRQLVHPIGLFLAYLLSFCGFGIVLGPVLYFAKPMSRHHAGFMLLLSLIAMGGVALYYYERYLRYDW